MNYTKQITKKLNVSALHKPKNKYFEKVNIANKTNKSTSKRNITPFSGCFFGCLHQSSNLAMLEAFEDSAIAMYGFMLSIDEWPVQDMITVGGMPILRAWTTKVWRPQ